MPFVAQYTHLCFQGRMFDKLHLAPSYKCDLQLTAFTALLGVQDLLTTEPDLAAGFQHTQFLVMDEADRLLEASFEPDLRAILTKLPAKRQTLLFSATMTKNLVALRKAVLPDAYHFQVGTCCSSYNICLEGNECHLVQSAYAAQRFISYYFCS